jgi:hypothetical protein
VGSRCPTQGLKHTRQALYSQPLFYILSTSQWEFSFNTTTLGGHTQTVSEMEQ